jgi:hypothetical protein
MTEYRAEKKKAEKVEKDDAKLLAASRAIRDVLQDEKVAKPKQFIQDAIKEKKAAPQSFVRTAMEEMIADGEIVKQKYGNRDGWILSINAKE